MAFTDSVAALTFKIKADGSNAEEVLKKFGGTLQKEVAGSSKTANAAIDKLTSSLGLSGEGFAALVNPVTLAAAGVAAVGTVAVSVGKELFRLAEQSAEFGASLYDAKIKAGLTAESIGALSFAANESNTNIGQIVTSVNLFTKQLGKAAEGSKSAREALMRVGLDPQTAFKSLEGSLETVFNKLNTLPANSVERLTLLKELFGRNGDELNQLLETIKKGGGTFEDFKKQLSDTGKILSEDDLKASKDFERALKDLEYQGKVLTTKFAVQYMPQITNAIQNVESFFATHQEGIKSFGQAIAGVIKTLGDLVQFVADHPTLFRIALAGATFGQSEVGINAVQSLQQIGKENQSQTVSQAKPETPATTTDDGFLNNQKEEQAAKEDYQKRISDAQEFSKEQRDTLEAQLADLKRIHERNLTETSDFANKSKRIATEIYNAELDSIAAQRKAITDAQDAGVEKDAVQKLNKLKTEEIEARRKYNEALQKTDDDASAERLKRLQDSFQNVEEVQKKLDEDKIATARDNAEKGKTTYAAAENEITKIQSDALHRRAAQLAEESKIIGDNQAERVKIVQQAKVLQAEQNSLVNESHRRFDEATKKDLEREISLREHLARIQEINNQRRFAEIDEQARTKQISLVRAVDDEYDVENNARIQKHLDLSIQASKQEGEEREATLRRISELEAETTAAYEEYQRRRRAAIIETNRVETEDASRGRYAEGTRQRVVPGQPVTRVKTGVEKDIQNIFGPYADESDKAIEKNGAVAGSFKDLGKSVQESAGNMVDALQNSIEAYLLYGESIGKALKMAAAQELAHIASVSAIKAIYQLAEGFALLFTAPQAAGAHFASAALYGSVAVGAGIAAKALAGSANKATSATTGAGSQGAGASAATSGVSSSSTEKVISESRRQSQDYAMDQIRDLLNKQTVKSEVTLNVKSDDSHIVSVLRNDAENKGDTERMVLKVLDHQGLI